MKVSAIQKDRIVCCITDLLILHDLGINVTSFDQTTIKYTTKDGKTHKIIRL